MKIKISFLVIIMAFFIGIGCKKNSNSAPENIAYCWQVLDVSGVPMYKLCDKTETEMKDSFPIPCSYYKLGDEEFCWLIDSGIYIPNVPEDYIKRFIKCYNNTSYTKVTCGYCQFWYTRQKSIYKPTNAAIYSSIRRQRLCGDTVSTLYQGRQVILRETTDSLIILQFSNNGSF